MAERSQQLRGVFLIIANISSITRSLKVIRLVPGTFIKMTPEHRVFSPAWDVVSSPADGNKVLSSADGIITRLKHAVFHLHNLHRLSSTSLS